MWFTLPPAITNSYYVQATFSRLKWAEAIEPESDSAKKLKYQENKILLFHSIHFLFSSDVQYVMCTSQIKLRVVLKP